MSNKFLTTDEDDIFAQPEITRSRLGLVFGQTVQSHSSKLDNISNLNFADNKIVKSTGSNTFELLNISQHGSNALNSDSALLTNTALSNYVTTTSLNSTLANYALTSAVPTNNNELTNGENYIKNSTDAFSYNNLSEKPTIPTNNTQLTNGENYITNSTDAFSYNNLSGKPTNLTTTYVIQFISR
jgi:hypothetical protein